MKPASTNQYAPTVLSSLYGYPLKSALVILCLVFIGCVQGTAYHKKEAPHSLPPNSRVLLMPTDIQLFELTAGGLEEPKVDWTIAAQKHVHAALKSILMDKQDTLIEYEPIQGDPDKARAVEQIVKLHEAVGLEITVHKYIQPYTLPTKANEFTWSLGSSVNRLTERYEADCALFIHIRDSYASAGRKAAMFIGALAGIGVSGGQQVGFSSLVDLRTGEIVWFGRIHKQSGDLRTFENAHQAVEQLLDGIPL